MYTVKPDNIHQNRLHPVLSTAMPKTGDASTDMKYMILLTILARTGLIMYLSSRNTLKEKREREILKVRIERRAYVATPMKGNTVT